MPRPASPASWPARLADLLGGRNRAAPVTAPVWRRLFHMLAGGVLANFILFDPQGLALPVVAAILVLASALELARLRLTRLNRLLLRWLAPLLKRDEDRRITGSTYMLAGALASLLLFDGATGAVSVLFLALGDPVAALAGRAAPGPRLWGKSPAGSVAFLAAGMAGVGAWVVWAGLPFHWSLVAAGVVAAVVEFLPLPVDDNLSVPLAAGVALWLMEVG